MVMETNKYIAGCYHGDRLLCILQAVIMVKFVSFVPCLGR